MVSLLVLGILNLHSGDETGQGKVRTKMIRGAGMDFQRGMWAEAWEQSVAARKFVALAVFGDFAIKWLEVSSSVVTETEGTIASTLFWACLAYVVHVQILLPHDRSSAMTGARFFGFALRFFGISLAMAAAAAGIALAVALMTFLLVKAQPPRALEVIVFLAGLALALTVFVRLGTLLPAYVAGRVGGVDAAIKRGKVHFRWIAGRLLIGPGLIFVFSGAAYWLLAITNGASVQFWIEERVFRQVNVPGYLLFNMVQAFVTALTAVILSRAFLRAEGIPDAATE